MYPTALMKCKFCNKEFDSTRGQVYCSTACRVQGLRRGYDKTPDPTPEEIEERKDKIWLMREWDRLRDLLSPFGPPYDIDIVMMELELDEAEADQAIALVSAPRAVI